MYYNEIIFQNFQIVASAIMANVSYTKQKRFQQKIFSYVLSAVFRLTIIITFLLSLTLQVQLIINEHVLIVNAYFVLFYNFLKNRPIPLWCLWWWRKLQPCWLPSGPRPRRTCPTSTNVSIIILIAIYYNNYKKPKKE